MRSRLLALTLSFYLAFALLACSSKPPEPTAGSTPAESKPKSEAAKAMVVPAGTVLTVRLGEAVGSRTGQPGQAFSAMEPAPAQRAGKWWFPLGGTPPGPGWNANPSARFKGGARLPLKRVS